MLLVGKTALVYGASGSVGSAVSLAFAREGAFVILAGRNQKTLEKTLDLIRESGGKAAVLTVDTMSLNDVKSHLNAAVERFGPIKLMFNAVSWDDVQGSPITEMPYDDFFKPVDAGLRTWYNTGTVMAMHMAEHGGGTILGITANAGRQPFSGVGGFGVACAAVEHFLRQLAVEMGPQNVRVCWVRSPGSPDSPGVRAAWEQYGKLKGMTFDEVHREFSKDVPLRHITGLSEVANAVVLLASDLASGMTATMANATGGAQVD